MVANKNHRIVRVVYEKDPPVVDESIAELLALTDREEPLRAARKATWKMLASAGEGSAYSARLGRRIFPAPASAATPEMPMPSGKKVIRVEAKIRLTKNGELAKLEFAVVKFDPSKR